MELAYQPIDCNFYDELEAWATLQQSCTIEFMDEAGGHFTTQAVIQDLFTDNHAEYMRLDNGLTLRLDRLIKVNGKVVPGYC